MHAIEVEGLQKSYGSLQAVKGISFYAETGRLFAFLGPNGAGKSTTLDMLCTLLKPDGGTALLGGHALGREDDAIRREIGVVFQDNMLDALLTVKENLEVRASLYGLQGQARAAAIEAAAKAGDVLGFYNRPYGKLSGGQRRRADIARALVHTPRILFLDEPTTGLDPQSRVNVWETVRRLQKEQGVTVFLTTHDMAEAAQADFVAIIKEGLLAAKGTPAQLRESHSQDSLSLRALDTEALRKYLAAVGKPFSEAGGMLHVPLNSTLEALPLLEDCQENLQQFEVKSGSLEEAFIKIIGEKLL